METTRKALVVACMERRLNGDDYLDALNDGNTLFCRTEGANVQGIKTTIIDAVQNRGVTDVIVMPHNDCGAMNAARAMLEMEIPDDHVRDFRPLLDGDTFT